MDEDCNGAASRLLNPDRLFTVSELRQTPALIPRAGGAYAWWLSTVPPGVPFDGTKIFDGSRLLYVGIAPRKPAPTEQGQGTRTLRDRLLNHCRGPIGSPTLRRTFATLLAPNLGLRVGRLPSGRIGMPAEDEAKLTDWMSMHARVNWVLSSVPWDVEDQLIGETHLPLNIRGSSKPFAKVLSKLRSLA
jgi:hypothetical protein